MLLDERQAKHPDRIRDMTDPNTFTAEHRSWEWEMVLRYEDGSLPVTSWNEATLGVVASWYAKNLQRDQATARYEQYYHRNRHRLTHRRNEALVDTNSIEAMDAVWQQLLTRALERTA
jgi:hypothetical protein